MTSRSNWPDFYADRLGPGYEDYCKIKYAAFLDQIKANMPCGAGSVVEMGCGTATITKLLCNTGFPLVGHVLVDRDADMLSMALFRMRHYLQSVTTVGVDFRHIGMSGPLPKYDLVHSHGVLEHYSDVEIVGAVDLFKQISPIQVHYVPGLYPSPSFGDERLLPLEHWQRLLGLDDKDAFAFNDGLDYCLTVRS